MLLVSSKLADEKVIVGDSSPESTARDHRAARRVPERISIEDLLIAAERPSGLSRQELCSKSKNRRTVAVKEAVIVLGRENGITNRALAEALGLGTSAVTKRVETSRARGAESSDLVKVRKTLRSRARMETK